jgi:hypothetical protein
MLLNYEETIFLKESEKKQNHLIWLLTFFKAKALYKPSQAKPNTLGSTTKRTQLFRLPCETHVLVNYIQLFLLSPQSTQGGRHQTRQWVQRPLVRP